MACVPTFRFGGDKGDRICTTRGWWNWKLASKEFGTFREKNGPHTRVQRFCVKHKPPSRPKPFTSADLEVSGVCVFIFDGFLLSREIFSSTLLTSELVFCSQTPFSHCNVSVKTGNRKSNELFCCRFGAKSEFANGLVSVVDG